MLDGLYASAPAIQRNDPLNRTVDFLDPIRFAAVSTVRLSSVQELLLSPQLAPPEGAGAPQ